MPRSRVSNQRIKRGARREMMLQRFYAHGWPGAMKHGMTVWAHRAQVGDGVNVVFLP